MARVEEQFIQSGAPVVQVDFQKNVAETAIDLSNAA